MFYPGEVWRDTDGNPIQAHGGGVLFHNGVYYWFGENKDGRTVNRERVDVIGISCYSSRNLYDWKNEGVVLSAVHDDPTSDLHPSKVVERPKVIYNEHTHQYVMWLHVDQRGYAYARAGVAVSDAPTGPYRYLGSMRPCDTDSRDLTVFKDDDGSAYLVFSSEWHRNITIARLTPDYLQPGSAFTKNFVHAEHPQGREAPAVFKHNGMYYMITSGCTGWDANPAEYAIADAMLGPWQVHGNPCVGPGANTTFDSQSTHVLPVVGKPGAFIFMADRWQPDDLQGSGYVWLPMRVKQHAVEIPWYDAWDFAVFDAPW